MYSYHNVHTVNDHDEVDQNSVSYHDSGNDLSAELANRIYNPLSNAIMNNQFLAMHNCTTAHPCRTEIWEWPSRTESSHSSTARDVSSVKDLDFGFRKLLLPRLDMNDTARLMTMVN